MKKCFFIVLFIISCLSPVLAASTYYNYKKEAIKGNSQIDFSSIDMKNLSEVNLTFVGMEFNAQGFADFVPLDKPVTLYASCSTDLRVKYKNRPSYEYDTKINKKDVHFKAKNYFYWNSYFQLLLLPDKKHASKLRCKFNGIENTLSSYIIEKETKENSRTFKFIKRVTKKVESLDFALANNLKEIPEKLSYCSDNLVYCKYNIHFGSGKPLFGKGNPNEVKDVTITFFATIKSIKTSDGEIVKYKTAEKPKLDKSDSTKPVTNNKSTKTVVKTKSKTSSKPNISKQNKVKAVENTAPKSDSKINSSTVNNSDIAPRTDSELDDDLVAEVVFETGAENSLKNEKSIAPRTDSELDNDLVD